MIFVGYLPLITVVAISIAIILVVRASTLPVGSNKFFTLIATPLGLLLLLPIFSVGLSIFFPVAGEIIFTLLGIYYFDAHKFLVGIFLLVLISSPITAWIGIKLLTRASTHHPKLNAIVLVSILVLSLIATVWFGYNYSQTNISKVIENAESTAGNQPYCIQFGNKQASELSEFSAWEMAGKDMFSFLRERFTGNRAVLALGEANQAKPYYWSHRHQSFRWEDGAPPVYCTPRRHFVKSLTTSQPPISQSKNLVFGLAGHLISIPKTFEPTAQGGPHPEFYLQMLAPGFKPRPKREKNDPLFNVESHASFTHIYMHKKDLAKEAQATNYRIIEKVGDEHGLTKNIFKYAGESGIHPPRFLYTATSPEGEVTTVIECSYTQHPMCSNEFLLDGWTYRFHHSPALLSEWKKMQDNLSDLIATFIVKNPPSTITGSRNISQ